MDSDLWPDALSSLGSTPTPMLPVPADLKAQIQAAQNHDALENSGEGLIDLAPFRTMTLVLHGMPPSFLSISQISRLINGLQHSSAAASRTRSR